MANLETEAKSAVQTAHKDLTGQHSSILYIMMTAVLILGCAMFYSNRSFEAHLAKAESLYADLQKSQKTDTAALNQHIDDRTQQTKQITNQDKLNTARDVQTATLETKLKLPNTTSQAVAQDYNKYTGYTVTQTPNKQDVVSQAAVQDATATKVDDIALKEDVVGLKANLATQTAMTASTQDDLTACVADEAKQEVVLKDYRSLAHKSRWQHILGGAEKVGLFAAGAAVSYEVEKKR